MFLNKLSFAISLLVTIKTTGHSPIIFAFVFFWSGITLLFAGVTYIFNFLFFHSFLQILVSIFISEAFRQLDTFWKAKLFGFTFLIFEIFHFDRNGELFHSWFLKMLLSVMLHISTQNTSGHMCNIISFQSVKLFFHFSLLFLKDFSQLTPFVFIRLGLRNLDFVCISFWFMRQTFTVVINFHHVSFNYISIGIILLKFSKKPMLICFNTMSLICDNQAFWAVVIKIV